MSAEEVSGLSKLSEQERKHWEDECKKCKAIEKSAGLAPGQVKKPKPTKSMHGTPSKMARKVCPNIYANKSKYYPNNLYYPNIISNIHANNIRIIQTMIRIHSVCKMNRMWNHLFFIFQWKDDKDFDPDIFTDDEDYYDEALEYILDVEEPKTAVKSPQARVPSDLEVSMQVLVR